LEKQVNSLIKKALKYIYTILYLCLFISSFSVFLKKRTQLSDFKIADISVSGQTVYGAETIITYSGLKNGESVIIPGGTKISAAIKKLWDSNLFSSIEVFMPAKP